MTKRVTSKEEVIAFLITFKKCWDKRVYNDHMGSKNYQTLFELGLTFEERAKEILNLECSDFYRGPSPDRDIPSQEFWEFGKMVLGREIYIKVKVYKDSRGKNRGKCTSFHFAEWPITYPYKKN